MDRVLCASLIMSFACSGGGDEKPPAPAPAPASDPPAATGAAVPVAKPDASGIVRITGDDEMKYNATRIEVPAGQKIRIELKHVGILPKTAMGHNLVVLKPGTDLKDFASKASGAMQQDYIPQGEAELASIVAYTRLLRGGESQTIEFDAPGPGSYPYLCTFPAHMAMMQGVLVVE
jgi:azurin